MKIGQCENESEDVRNGVHPGREDQSQKLFCNGAVLVYRPQELLHQQQDLPNKLITNNTVFSFCVKFSI